MALYWQRWRLEDAFAVVKRLLGLAYFWSGSSNGVQVQVWATWLVYAVLVDLTDAVAAELEKPFQRCRWRWSIAGCIISLKPLSADWRMMS